MQKASYLTMILKKGILSHLVYENNNNEKKIKCPFKKNGQRNKFKLLVF